jgi:uncharacterized GH25 family protein
MPRLRTLLYAALLLVAPDARAHDYWLEFQPLHPPADAELALTLWVGEDFAAEAEKPMQRHRTAALRHVTRAGDEDLLPRAVDGAAPLARVRLAAGGHLFSLERNLARIDMRALKFNRYLRHEGLRAALAERKRSGERLRRARERYTRHLKAFVQVGDAADGVSTRVLGQRLELVPDRELAGLRPGERFGVVLRFEGAPLAGAQVEAFVRPPGGGAPRGQLGVTDAAGRVEFAATEAGAWLVRTVHMQRCRGCADADWESLWAGYAFALR